MVKSLKETNKSCVTAQGQHNGIQSRHQISVEAKQARVNRARGWKNFTPSYQDVSLTTRSSTEDTQFAGDCNNFYRPREWLIVEEDIELSISKKKLRKVHHAQNMTVTLLSQNTKFVFSRGCH